MSNKDLGLSPLTHIKNNLDRLFGKGLDSWPGWELETITESLGVGFSELARDKIHLLQILENQPDIFLGDIAFFLYATKVINNEVADFEYLPMPSILELGYSITQFLVLSGITQEQLKSADDLIDCVAYLLKEEGLSDNIAPFEFIPKDKLVQGQTPMDTANKIRAVELYTRYMDSL